MPLVLPAGTVATRSLCNGLSNWMDSKGYARLEDFVGQAVPNVTDWQFLNMKYDIKARIKAARAEPE